MKAKKWFQISISILLTALLGNFLFLYLSDIYGVSHPKRTEHYSAIHQRFLIVEYILDNIDKYDTLLFGSSRVQFINPLHVKDGKVYNMTVAEGIPHEHLIMIKLFLEKGMNIKHIILSVDASAFQVSFASHQNNLETKSHYLATGDSQFNFYQNYYFRMPKKKDFNHFEYIKKDIQLYKRHHNIIFHQEKAFSTEQMSYNQPKPDNPVFLTPILYHGYDMDNTVNDIEEIVTICKENKIKLTLFINPIHHTTYKHTNHQQLEDFLQRLSYITPYYDFTLPNEVSKNNKYWLESSHYTHEVGDMMLNRIFENNTSIKDFGIYIKKKEKN